VPTFFDARSASRSWASLARCRISLARTAFSRRRSRQRASQPALGCFCSSVGWPPFFGRDAILRALTPSVESENGTAPSRDRGRSREHDLEGGQSVERLRKRAQRLGALALGHAADTICGPAGDRTERLLRANSPPPDPRRMQERHRHRRYTGTRGRRQPSAWGATPAPRPSERDREVGGDARISSLAVISAWLSDRRQSGCEALDEDVAVATGSRWSYPSRPRGTPQPRDECASERPCIGPATAAIRAAVGHDFLARTETASPNREEHP
jgi:hypothetical protein